VTSPPAKPGVVSDTGPVNYLLQIEHIVLLPQLVGRVWAPQAVVTELTDRAAPDLVRRWMAHVPDWFLVQEPSSPLGPMAGGAGERAAIALARENIVRIAAPHG
jgi:predicted nucleic acid-binding protein